MPVESDADLASFFNTDEFAVSATYTPADGVAVAVTVIDSRPKRDGDTGIVGIQATAHQALIRAAELGETPARGDQLDIADECFTVRKATPDETRRVFTLELAPL